MEDLHPAVPPPPPVQRQEVPHQVRVQPPKLRTNIDDRVSGDYDGNIARRGFSARSATSPASTKSSMDLGSRDAPPFIVDDGREE